MSDLPPPPPSAEGSATADEPAPRAWKTWQLAAASGVALVLGIGLGSAGDEPAPETISPTGASSQEVAALDEQVADLKAELEARDETLAAARSEIEALRAEPAPEPDEAAEPDPEPEPEADPEPAGDTTDGELTAGQRNARSAAQNYLSIAPFSRSGLIGQLEFEGYATADATFGVDAVDPDWNEQAAKAAENYLEISPFSRSGLIDQLIFEGFTRSQAEFGVDQAGL